MLAPAPPGKRRERLRFDLSLLFSPETSTEYSSAEVRARSLGLRGKKWGPLSTFPTTSSRTVKVKFDDDAKSNFTKIGGRRKSTLAGEPTVTINTKEALADVFGMYNSPDEATVTLAKVNGDKHQKISSGSRVNVSAPTQRSNESNRPKTPGGSFPYGRSLCLLTLAAFRPFVDENSCKSTAKKENSKPMHQVLQSIILLIR
jgi:checkpoint serine/threonine-protein kinase